MGNPAQKPTCASSWPTSRTCRAAVPEGINRGQSLQQMQAEIRLDRYASYAEYREWLRLNVKGAYDQLVLNSRRRGQEK
jgi:hypothetical protein